MIQVLQPQGWPKPNGYANGIAAQGRMIFTAGQVGWDERYHFGSSKLADQARQALRNVVAVLAEAGARPEHIVRLTWYVTDKNEYMTQQRELGEAYREIIGNFYPAMAVVQVLGLVEDAAKVEIEATAVIPG
jgi:enamine deaminase RidA (YjgF/YER057c/UK114 family)